MTNHTVETTNILKIFYSDLTITMNVTGTEFIIMDSIFFLELLQYCMYYLYIIIYVNIWYLLLMIYTEIDNCPKRPKHVAVTVAVQS